MEEFPRKTSENKTTSSDVRGGSHHQDANSSEMKTLESICWHPNALCPPIPTLPDPGSITIMLPWGHLLFSTPPEVQEELKQEDTGWARLRMVSASRCHCPEAVLEMLQSEVWELEKPNRFQTSKELVFQVRSMCRIKQGSVSHLREKRLSVISTFNSLDETTYTGKGNFLSLISSLKC